MEEWPEDLPELVPYESDDALSTEENEKETVQKLKADFSEEEDEFTFSDLPPLIPRVTMQKTRNFDVLDGVQRDKQRKEKSSGYTHFNHFLSKEACPAISCDPFHPWRSRQEQLRGNDEDKRKTMKRKDLATLAMQVHRLCNDKKQSSRLQTPANLRSTQPEERKVAWKNPSLQSVAAPQKVTGSFGGKSSEKTKVFQRDDLKVIALDNEPVKKSSQEIQILPEVIALEGEMIEDRRHIHKYPELSYEEVETAAYIADKLRSYGNIEVTEQVGRTGVVGVLRGALPGPCLALRADMDALPLQEEVDVDWKSVNDGVMHACGHDAHCAMLLCAAQVLSRETESIQGIVKFIFQPAEEGGAGALAMVEDGVLENPNVDEVYGIHLRGARQVGEMELGVGPISASSDTFTIELEGSGGHGARPHQTEDVVLIGATLVVQLHQIVPRNVEAQEPAVLTVGALQSGTASNIISSIATITGTIRTFNEDVRDIIFARINDLCQATSIAHPVKVTLTYRENGYPPVVNETEEHVNNVRESAVKIVDADMIYQSLPDMTGEDFSFYLQRVPGCFFRVGAAGPDPDWPNNHSPMFTIDERSLSVGASVWIQLVRDQICAIQKKITRSILQKKPESQRAKVKKWGFSDWTVLDEK